MAESAGLLIRYVGKPASRVRIPFSPPLLKRKGPLYAGPFFLTAEREGKKALEFFEGRQIGRTKRQDCRLDD